MPAVENPRNSIFRIAYNRCYRWVEKQQVKVRGKSRIAAEGEAPANPVEDAYSFKETYTMVQAAVDKLTPLAKFTVIRFYWRSAC